MFCPSCGGSYEKRICHRGHANSRSAKVCGECGSRELSHAQPQRRFSLVAGFTLLRVLFGAALIAGTIVFAIDFAMALVRDPRDLLSRMLLGLGLAIAWAVFVLM